MKSWTVFTQQNTQLCLFFLSEGDNFLNNTRALFQKCIHILISKIKISIKIY